MVKQISKIALKGVAMAMGIAVIVMSTLGTLELDNGVWMLGLGPAALTLASLQE